MTTNFVIFARMSDPSTRWVSALRTRSGSMTRTEVVAAAPEGVSAAATSRSRSRARTVSTDGSTNCLIGHTLGSGGTGQLGVYVTASATPVVSTSTSATGQQVLEEAPAHVVLATAGTVGVGAGHAAPSDLAMGALGGMAALPWELEQTERLLHTDCSTVTHVNGLTCDVLVSDEKSVYKGSNGGAQGITPSAFGGHVAQGHSSTSSGGLVVRHVDSSSLPSGTLMETARDTLRTTLSPSGLPFPPGLAIPQPAAAIVPGLPVWSIGVVGNSHATSHLDTGSVGPPSSTSPPSGSDTHAVLPVIVSNPQGTNMSAPAVQPEHKSSHREEAGIIPSATISESLEAARSLMQVLALGSRDAAVSTLRNTGVLGLLWARRKGGTATVPVSVTDWQSAFQGCDTGLGVHWQGFLAGGLQRKREVRARYEDDASRYDLQVWPAGQEQWNSNRLERFVVDKPTMKVRPVSSLAGVSVCLSWSNNGSAHSMLADGIFALVLNGSGTPIDSRSMNPAALALIDHSVVVLGIAPSEVTSERRLTSQPRQLGNDPMPVLVQEAEVDRYWQMAITEGLERREVPIGWAPVVMITTLPKMGEHLWVRARSEALRHRMDIAVCATDLLRVGLSPADYGGGGEDACLFRAMAGAMYNLVGVTRSMLVSRTAPSADHGSAVSLQPSGDIDTMERALRSATTAYATQPWYLARMLLQTTVSETLSVPSLAPTQCCMIEECEFFAAPPLVLCSSHASQDTSTLRRRSSVVLARNDGRVQINWSSTAESPIACGWLRSCCNC